MQKLLSFLDELAAKKIAFRLDRTRAEAIMVEVFVPGEHWEVEFFENDEVEIEVFRSDGKILDESALTGFWKRFSD